MLLIHTLLLIISGLHHLFIGAEGTLGVVTKINLLTTRRLPSEQVAFLGVSSFEKTVDVLKRAKCQLGEIMSAFEFLDAGSLDLVRSYMGVTSPLEGESHFYVLIETQGSNESHDMEKLLSFLGRLQDDGVIQDGTVAQSPDQRNQIWQIRERITLALSKKGEVYKYDLSFPVERMYDLVEDVKKRLSDIEDCTVVGYGHMGDGNLHLNVSVPFRTDRVTTLLEPYVYDFTRDMHGSVSAEHGIGILKRKYLGHSRSKESIEMMRLLKKVLDPNNVLNPNKVLCAEDEEK